MQWSIDPLLYTRAHAGNHQSMITDMIRLNSSPAPPERRSRQPTRSPEPNSKKKKNSKTKKKSKK